MVKRGFQNYLMKYDRRHARIRCVFFLVVVIVGGILGLFPCLARADHDQLRKVLIINSYHPGYGWSDDELAGVFDILKKRGDTVQKVVEYLDLKRYSGELHLQELKHLFSRKYKDDKFAAIITMDNPALQFVVDNRLTLFKDIPVVFCGVNDFRHEMLLGDRNITGIAEKLDAKGTLELMLSLHKNVREIVVINDYTVTGLAVRREVESIVPRLAEKVSFRFIDDLTIDEILKELETLPDTDLVFLGSYARDKKGEVFGAERFTKLVIEHSTVPVYAVHENRLGLGIAGGSLLGGKAHGSHAAEVALKILAGEKPWQIPIVTGTDAKCVVDDAVISAHGISRLHLPKTCSVINEPEPYYKSHQNVIVIALSIISVLCAVITLLALNISQRRRAVGALRSSELRQRAVLDNIPDPVWVKDKDNRYTAVNEAWSRATGKKASEVVGRFGSELSSGGIVHGLVLTEPGHHDEDHTRREQRVTLEGGKVSWFDSIEGPLIDVNGTVIGSVGIARDITDLKFSEEALRKSEATLRSLFYASPVGIALVSPQRHVMWMNERMSVITGYGIDELNGESFVRILYESEEEYNRVGKVVYGGAMAGRIGEAETRWVHKKQDSILDMHLSAAAIDPQDISAGIVLIARDITTRKQAEESLKTSLREKEVLLREIHHRVKNNLQIISSLLNLQSGYIKDGEALDMFKESINRIKTMAHIHEKLYQSRDYARINFSDYVDDLTSQLYSSYGLMPDCVRLRTKIEDIPLDISTAIPLGLIINELVSNAMKHAFPDGRRGEIGIFMKRETGAMDGDGHSGKAETNKTLLENEGRKSDRFPRIVLTVSDNGKGFPEDLDFRNTESLGLQLVMELTEQLEGQVELIRHGKTKFMIIIPEEGSDTQ